MLDRRGWYIALLGPRIGCLEGFQTGNWVLKNLAGKKKKTLATKTNLAGAKNWRPDKNYLDGNEYYESGNS